MSLKNIRYWIIAYPDASTPFGGVKQLHRLAETLNHLGRTVSLIQDDAQFHPGWFHSVVETISKKDWLATIATLSPYTDVLIIPETYLAGLPAIAHGLPVVVFNQNASYSYRANTSERILKPNLVSDLYSSLLHVICVSRYDYDLIHNGIGVPRSRLSLIPNALEVNLCRPDLPKKKRISYMPRKNPIDSIVVAHYLSNQTWMSDWDLFSIDNCSHLDVIHSLKKSLIFLSFGHPEGFGLPVAEAMACGCAVVGYSGLGGRELFNAAQHRSTAQEVSFGDWFGFIHAVHRFVEDFNADQSSFFNHLLATSDYVRSTYSPDRMNVACSRIFDGIESCL